MTIYVPVNLLNILYSQNMVSGRFQNLYNTKNSDEKSYARIHVENLRPTYTCTNYNKIVIFLFELYCHLHVPFELSIECYISDL